MKRGIVLLSLMMLGAFAFAQGYKYEDQAYAAAANKMMKLEVVKNLPRGFFFDRENMGDKTTYNDRYNLFYTAKNQYQKNKQSFAAAYNYGAVLTSEAQVDDYSFLPHKNAEEARVVLSAAIALNPKSVESYKLLDKALEYLLFNDERVNMMQNVNARSYNSHADPHGERGDFSSDYYYFRYYDNVVLKIYSSKPALTQERLNAFEKRIALRDDLNSQEYREASLMCQALGRFDDAEDYIMTSEKLEKQEATAAEEEAVRQGIARAKGISEQETKRSFKEIYLEMLKNLNLDIK